VARYESSGLERRGLYRALKSANEAGKESGAIGSLRALRLRTRIPGDKYAHHDAAVPRDRCGVFSWEPFPSHRLLAVCTRCTEPIRVGHYVPPDDRGGNSGHMESIAPEAGGVRSARRTGGLFSFARSHLTSWMLVAASTFTHPAPAFRPHSLF